MNKQLKNDFIQMTSIKEEVLDAKDYLKLSPEDRANIEKSQIIPPKLGVNNFGKIMVKYRIPVYRQRYV